METNKKTFRNPPAFPNINTHERSGMSLRDYFANSVLQSYLSAQYAISKDGEKTCSDENICNEAYRIANAMLKAREINQ